MFIYGAQKEVKRLEVSIDCLKDNPDNSGLVEYMITQKELLNIELRTNIEYDKKESVLDNGKNRPQIAPFEYALDYYSIYKNK